MKNLATFILKGNVPSKKNSRNIFVKGARVFNLPSERHEIWHKYASEEIKKYTNGLTVFTGPVIIELTFTPGDNRQFDLTNKAESVMDLLVNCNVIIDDSVKYVPEVRLYTKEVKKNEASVHIIIKDL